MQSVNKEPGGRKLEQNELALLPRETLIESQLCLNATACSLVLYYEAIRDYMPHSHWGGVIFGVTLLRAFWTKQQLLITQDVTVRLLWLAQVPVKHALTMLCLRIRCTTGVNTSITTIDRGRSRQCCKEQVIEWAAELATWVSLSPSNLGCKGLLKVIWSKLLLEAGLVLKTHEPAR